MRTHPEVIKLSCIRSLHSGKLLSGTLQLCTFLLQLVHLVGGGMLRAQNCCLQLCLQAGSI